MCVCVCVCMCVCMCMYECMYVLDLKFCWCTPFL